MSIRLHYSLQEALPAGQVHLHFGWPAGLMTALLAGTAPSASVDATAVVTWPPLVASATWHGHRATSSGHATRWDWLRKGARCHYVQAAPALLVANALWGQQPSLRADCKITWQERLPAVSRTDATWSYREVTYTVRSGRWGRFASTRQDGVLPWTTAGTVRQSHRVCYTLPGLELSASVRVSYSHMPRLVQEAISSWSLAAEMATARGVVWQSAPLRRMAGDVSWNRLVKIFWRLAPPQKTPNPAPAPIPPGPIRLFYHLPGWPIPPGIDIRLHYGTRPKSIGYAIHMITDLSCVLLPHLEPLRFQSLSIEWNRDSHSRLLRATILGHDSMALLQPDAGLNPVEVRTTLNGYSFDFVVTQITGTSSVAAHTWEVTAESPILYLTTPYAAARDYLETQTRTAQQLALQELTDTGFELEWDVVDWLVPAGVWSYQGLTPLEAIKRLAAAAGGHVEDHPTDHKIFVRSDYHIEPWLWSLQQPAVILSGANCRSLTDQQTRYADTNRVIVSGGAAGKVRVDATRSGTAGDRLQVLSPEPLWCHVDVGRERARQALASAGYHVDEVLADLPLAPAPNTPGVLQLGDIVEVHWLGSEWIGQVIGNQINAAMGSLTQTLTVDRFYG